MSTEALASVRTALPRASRYELLGLIARGGMASVYVGRLAGAAGFSRLVAIKRAHEHIAADVATRKLIVEEARLASNLHHPNVVAVQDVEVLDDELLLVMEYVEGASLARLIVAANRASGPLDSAVVIRILLDISAGLAAAHELTDELGQPLPLVHRDVSPQNILLGIDGVARLTDFGIAKSFEGGAGATHSGSLVGKVAYMAPEYIEGHRIDGRADLFALGIVAWEALANERLFKGSSEAQTMRQVLSYDPPPMHERLPGFPRELAAVIGRALRKDPAERQDSVRDFARALEQAARQAQLVADNEAVAGTVRTLIAPALTERRADIRRRLASLTGEALADGSGSGPWPRLPLSSQPQSAVVPVPAVEEQHRVADPGEGHTAVLHDGASAVADDGVARAGIDALASTNRRRRVLLVLLTAFCIGAVSALVFGLRTGPETMPIGGSTVTPTAEPVDDRGDDRGDDLTPTVGSASTEQDAAASASTSQPAPPRGPRRPSPPASSGRPAPSFAPNPY